MTHPEAIPELADRFLDDIERWRVRIAGDMAAQNRRLDERQLERAVERTLDRVVFLRLAEERGLETFGTLLKLAKGSDLHQKLEQRFRRANARYGGNLFQLAPAVTLGDPLLREVLSALYPAGDPHELALLPADILGRVHEARAKPDARKAGGVFYTPARIVDYILTQTLGRLLDGETPAAAARIRVLDPACGSGSFLLGAYQFLLDWHLRWYLDHDPERTMRGRSAPLAKTDGGAFRLTAAKRKEILEGSIFGVDIDGDAAEVAKLSLILMLEGPVPGDLDGNVRAGHALIGPDQGGAVPRGTEAFDWRDAFPQVFSGGGFDAVIGNPPYLSFGGRHAVEISKELRSYYADHYESGGWPTSHTLFLERSLKLLSSRYVSFVVPDQVGHLGGYASARDIAQREAGIIEVRYWGERVFPGVTTPAMTVVLDKQQKGAPTLIVDHDGQARKGLLCAQHPWNLSPATTLIDRLRADAFSLGKLVGDCGIRTTSAEDQIVNLTRAKGEVLPVLEGKVVGRYSCLPPRVGVRLASKKPLFMSRDERYRAATFVIRQTAAYPIVGPREHALHFRNSLLALFSPAGLDVRYLVALLNSKLLRFVYVETVRESRQRAFPQVKVKALQSLPVRRIELTRADDKKRHDELVALAQRALDVQSEMAKRPEKTHALAARFDAIDRQIDRVVYDLYGLSVEEQNLVEQTLAAMTAPRAREPLASGPSSVIALAT